MNRKVNGEVYRSQKQNTWKTMRNFLVLSATLTAINSLPKEVFAQQDLSKTESGNVDRAADMVERVGKNLEEKAQETEKLLSQAEKNGKLPKDMDASKLREQIEQVKQEGGGWKGMAENLRNLLKEGCIKSGNLREKGIKGKAEGKNIIVDKLSINTTDFNPDAEHNGLGNFQSLVWLAEILVHEKTHLAITIKGEVILKRAFFQGLFGENPLEWRPYIAGIHFLASFYKNVKSNEADEKKRENKLKIVRDALNSALTTFSEAGGKTGSKFAEELRQLLKELGILSFAPRRVTFNEVDKVLLAQEYIEEKGGTLSSANLNLRMMVPEIVAQGDSFWGTIMAITDSGESPLVEGDQVSFQGQVVPVQEGGRIKIPPIFKEAGNFFLIGQIIQAANKLAKGEPPTTTPQHVEIIPTSQGGAADSVKIAHAPEIVNSSSEIRVEGQHLNRLDSAMLVGKNDTVILDPIAGSSFQQIYAVRKGEKFPKGDYLFEASDTSGHRYKAPIFSANPTLRITGTKLKHVGERGYLKIACSKDANVMLYGGEPQITLEKHFVSVRAEVATKVGFTADVLGEYSVKGRLMDRSSIPDSLKGSRVDSKKQPIETKYDPKKDSTIVAAPVQIVDEKGNPVKDVSVDVAVSYPKGVEYVRETTNRRGIAKFVGSFPGQIASGAVTASVYRVLEHTWKRPPSPTPQDSQQPPVTTPQEEVCKANKVECTYTYSRGNNDVGQMKDQKKNTKGKTYQYQTCTFEFKLTVDPSKCTCKNEKCVNKIIVGLEMKILRLTKDSPKDPTAFDLLDGVEASGTTTNAGSNAPGPDITTTIDQVDFPPERPDNKIRKIKPNLREYEAKAKFEIDCWPSKETWKIRFHVSPLGKAGQKAQTPGGGGPFAYVDVIVDTKKVTPCQLKIELKEFHYLEFLPGYDFDHVNPNTYVAECPGASDELPEIDYTESNGKKGHTRNIAKLIEFKCDKGKPQKYDGPFLPKK